MLLKQENAFGLGLKDYDRDLEKVSGQKGSNEGGLYKDKQLQTIHYVKWSSDNRARVEGLAAALYDAAGAPVPHVGTIPFGGKLAVKSDWLENATPMTFAAMAKSPDVRNNFVVDAWLANWDVVGQAADNIVAAGGKAHRIDLGGSILFRAQGKPKTFPDSVPELESMRSASTAPKAAQVFKDLTQKELKAGAAAVSGISDGTIDQLVAESGLPMGPIPEYPGKDNIQLFVANTLKKRRDYITANVLNAKPEKKLTKKDLAAIINNQLSPEITEFLTKTALTKLAGSGPTRAVTVDKVLRAELGEKLGAQATASINKTYGNWKVTAAGDTGNFLRWAMASTKGRGDEVEKRIIAFWKQSGQKALLEQNKAALALNQTKHGAPTVAGANVSSLANALIWARTANGPKVTIWRRWNPDQRNFLGWKDAKVGDKLPWSDPLAFSWTASYNVFQGGPGSLRTKMEVDVEDLIVTDKFNNTHGSYAGENELVWVPAKGKTYEMEVINA